MVPVMPPTRGDLETGTGICLSGSQPWREFQYKIRGWTSTWLGLRLGVWNGDESLRIQVSPKEGISPIILFWGWDLNPQSYSREVSGVLGNSFESLFVKEWDFFLSNFVQPLVQIQQKYKVPGTPNNQPFSWLFQLDESKSLHNKWLFHQTSIKKWWFRVPGM